MNLDYSAKVVQFNGWNPDAYSAFGISGPDDAGFAKRILCEGDSWFSIGAIPSSNMLVPLRFSQSTLLINLATPGDTIKRMSDIKQNVDFKKLVLEDKFSTKWDAIFLSGGGNDLIDMANQIICRPSHGAGREALDYIDRVCLARLKANVQIYYKAVAATRSLSKKNKDTPIVTHVYDYPTPRYSQARFLGFNVTGPWLYPAFKQCDIPEEFWMSVTDYIFEELGSALVGLTSQIDNFYVICATKGRLTRAKLGTTEPDGDWLNEIHPTTRGYEKLAEVVSPELNAIVNGARY